MVDLQPWVIGVREVVAFHLTVDGKQRLVYVSRECLGDHFGMTGSLKTDGPSALVAHAKEICAKAVAKINAGQPDPVLVESADF